MDFDSFFKKKKEIVFDRVEQSFRWLDRYSFTHYQAEHHVENLVRACISAPDSAQKFAFKERHFWAPLDRAFPQMIDEQHCANCAVTISPASLGALNGCKHCRRVIHEVVLLYFVFLSF